MSQHAAHKAIGIPEGTVNYIILASENRKVWMPFIALKVL